MSVGRRKLFYFQHSSSQPPFVLCSWPGCPDGSYLTNYYTALIAGQFDEAMRRRKEADLSRAQLQQKIEAFKRRRGRQGEPDQDPPLPTAAAKVGDPVYEAAAARSRAEATHRREMQRKEAEDRVRHQSFPLPKWQWELCCPLSRCLVLGEVWTMSPVTNSKRAGARFIRACKHLPYCWSSTVKDYSFWRS